MKSPEAGARTQIYCAVAPELQDQSGGFYSNCKPYSPSPLARDDALAEELWRLSEQWCGIASPATQRDEVNGQGS